MLELKIKQGRKHVPIYDLPAYLGPEFAAKEIGMAVEGLIAFLDELDGDPDFEEDHAEDGFATHAADGPGCPIADPGSGYYEDDEDDDPREEDDDSGQCDEDGVNTKLGALSADGAGCIISDDDSDWQSAGSLALNDN